MLRGRGENLQREQYRLRERHVADRDDAERSARSEKLGGSKLPSFLHNTNLRHGAPGQAPQARGAPLRPAPPGEAAWGNCSSSAEGGWLLPAMSASSAVHYGYAATPAPSCCSALCASCEMCKYLAVSEARRDCRWYSSCDLRNLSLPAAALGFGTVRARGGGGGA